MKKTIGGVLLVIVGLIGSYEAWAYWTMLTKAAVFMLGAFIGACIASGLLMLMWRPQHPATRYQANLPSPYERQRTWR